MDSKVTIWVTGKCGSGKSTVAVAIAEALVNLGCNNVVFTDGQNDIDETYHTLYRLLCKNTGIIKKVLPNIDVQINTLQEKR